MKTAIIKKVNRAISLLTVIVMTVGLLPTTIFGASANFNITTVEQLMQLAMDVNGGNAYEGTTITLSANLDLGGNTGISWTPIGNDTTKFGGTFDGTNHVISGLNINATTANQGLFGTTSATATISSLTVSGEVYTTSNNCGGIVGANSGVIQNCHNAANVTYIKTVKYPEYNHGGIAGSSTGTIKNSYNSGNISGYNAVGGIVGNTTSGGGVKSCYNTGAIIGGADISTNVGGIAGSARVSVENSYNVGTVTGATNVGGVLGRKQGSGKATNCYYLNTTASFDIGSESSEVGKKTEADLKNVDFVATINGTNDGFSADTTTINNGYPIFSWQTMVDTSEPVKATFPEKTALSKTLSQYIKSAFASYKTVANLGPTDSVLATFTESSTNTDWTALAMGRYGYFDNSGAYKFLDEDNGGYQKYLDAVKVYMTDTYGKNAGILHPVKATEWHRAILAINAIGGDPTNFGTYNEQPINLVADGTYNNKNPGAQGVNGLAYALMALDSKGYDVPADGKNTREKLIKDMLALQIPDGVNGNEFGGWELGNKATDPDICAMVIEGLAPYYFDNTAYTYTSITAKKEVTKTVRQAVDEALEKLSTLQRPEGDFASFGVVNCESTAQTLLALLTLGIDPATDTRFIKNGNTLLDGVMRYKLANGGFSHILYSKFDQIATDQATYSLVAYWRYENGLRSLYDCRNDQTATVKTAIKDAMTAIDGIPTPENANYKTAISTALTAFNNVEKTERRYVYNYSKLARAVDIVGGEGNLTNNNKYVTNIEIATQPAKIVYTEMDDFDTTGMVVNLVYNDGTKEATTDYMCTPSKQLALENTEIIVKCGLHKVALPITVNDKIPWIGEGTASSPYLISTLEDLNWIKYFTNTRQKPTTGIHYKMTADIDLTTEEWVPIAAVDGNPFNGVFDGDGHAVYNLTMGKGRLKGFFSLGGDQGVIKNLGIASGTINQGMSSFAGGVLAWSDGTDVINCWNNATIVGSYNGGIVGTVRAGTSVISGCYNSGVVTSSKFGGDAVGGIVGHISHITDENNQVTISNCYNKGDVTPIGGVVGGIVGKAQNGIFTNCYNVGKISTTNSEFDHKGAIVGQLTHDNTVSGSCYLATDGLVGVGDGIAEAVGKTADEMKNSDTLKILGAEYKADYVNQINNGYPILSWEKPALAYDVTFTAEPITAVITVKNMANIVVAPTSKNVYSLVNGTYTYTATAGGYQDKTGTFTVSGAAQNIAVNLTPSGGGGGGSDQYGTISTTLKDGVSHKGSRLTFDVIARDANGNKIDASNIVVTLNGDVVPKTWDDNEKTSYKLVFTQAGNNAIVIKAADVIQSYKINYIPAVAGEVVGKAALSVEAFTIGGGYLVEPKFVDIIEGENGAQFLDRVIKGEGLTYEHTGSIDSAFYLSVLRGDKVKNAVKWDGSGISESLKQQLINATFDISTDDIYNGGLGEFNFTRGAGWMYCANNVFPNVGFADYFLSDGNTMRIQFTLALGSDIGGSPATGGNSGFYSTANKDDLTYRIAEINSMSNKSAVLKKSNNMSKYNIALDVLKKLDSTQDEVNSALLGVNDLDMSSGGDTGSGGTGGSSSGGGNKPPIPPVVPGDKKDEGKKDEKVDDAKTENGTTPTFTDVDEGYWAKDYIYKLSKAGIINGKTDNVFAPDDNITRAEFVTLLARISGEETAESENNFADIDPNEWYAKYVSWATKAGIANGTEENKFLPNDNINRQDMAVMITRFADYVKCDLSGDSKAEATLFDDETAIMPYAVNAVTTMQKVGIINGKEDNKFAPNDNATRGEAAKMLAMFMDLMEK